MKIFRGINQILDLGFSPEGTERKELMVEHTVSFSFERSVYIKLEKGDSITHNGKLFYLKDDYIPTVNKSTNGFVYDLKFYDIMERMKDIKLKYNGEIDFKLTVTGGQFLDVVVSSFSGITKGSFPTDIKEIHFENVSVFDALNLITETYDTEWWLNGSTLNLSKCEFGAPVILRLDTELEDISVSQSSETLVTRLYAKGSTRNIPKGYSQDNRLKLATGFIDLIPDLPESKIIEGVHIFEDIYPRQTTSIVEVIQGSVGDTPIFTIRGNNAFTITQNDVIPGQPLKIAFNTGNLAGREFELIIRADNKFEIKYIQDGELVIPNLTLKPAIGDEFFFFNFNAESVLPTLISQAENELLVAAQDYLDNLGSQLVYDCETRSIHCEQNVIDLEIGQVVTIQSENIGSVTTRIRAYEKQLLNSFECKYQAGDYSKYSRLKEIANRIKDSTPELQTLKSTLEYVFQDGIVTETELKSIEAILTNLSVERGQLNAQYLVVRGNVNLINKTPLETAWSNYQTAFVDVETAINNAITDKLISDAEKANIDNKISVYSTRTNEFATALENARVAIEDNKNQGVLDVVDQNKQYLQDQIDGVVDNWFYPYSPTLANYPASDWATNTIKDRHIGDTFTNTQQAPATDAGKSWRFVKNGSVYSWTQIADSDAVLALQKAAQAQSTADGKSTTYLIQPTSYKLGDMWVLAADQTVNGVAYKSGEILTATQDSTTFVQAHWVKKVRYTDDTAVENLEIGGRNLILNTTIPSSQGSPNWVANNWFLSDKMVSGWHIIRFKYITAGTNNIGISLGTNGVYDGSHELNPTLTAGTGYYEAPVNFTRTTQNSLAIYTNEAITISELMLVRGNKITTDWTPAPEDVEASIDAAKQEALTAAGNAQTSANNANTAVGDLNTYVDGSFKDGVIEASEAKAIEKYINIVNTEKSNIEATYNILYANTYLEGTPKTNLLNAKVTYFGAVDTLINSINSAISDGKTTIAEKQAVDTNYSSYKTALASLKTAIENANKAIQAKLDTLSTEKVNSLQIGGRNYWRRSYLPTTLTGTTQSSLNSNNGFDVLVGTSTNGAGNARKNEVITSNGWWVLSGYIKTNGITGSKADFFEFCDIPVQGTVTYNSTDWTYFEVKANVTNYSSTLYNFIDFIFPVGWTWWYFKDIKLEKGTKATDWTPAPEDVEASIDAAKQEALTAAGNAQNTANSLKDFTDTAFRDGIINRSESVAIEKYKNSLNEAMSKAEASYNKVYLNTYLPEGTAKTSLLNAKINLWGQRDTLLSAINTAISGGTTTPAQKTSVDNAFNTFNNLMTAFQNALEEANKAIQVKLDNLSKGYVNDLEIGGRNLIKNSSEEWVTVTTTTVPYIDNFFPTTILEAEQEYTFSWEAEIVSGTPYGFVHIGCGTTTYQMDILYSNVPIIGKNKVTFKPTSADLATHKSFAFRWYNGGMVFTFRYRKLKLEKGNKATDWTPAPEDVQAEIDAEKTRINDILSDNVADPSEKQYLSNLWQEIYVEYPRIWAQANTYAVDKSNYEAKYSALNTLLSPVLANLTTNSTVSGASIRTAFSQYYDARTFLLNNITNKVNTTAADALAKANTSKAVTDKFGTTVNGGLIQTVMMLLRELNSQQETAGISGIQGALKNNPAFWSGGTYEKAFALIQFLSKMSAGTTPSAGEYSNLAKITLLHNGAGKYGDLIIEESGRVVMVNPLTGEKRLVFSVNNIPDAYELIDANTGSGSTNNTLHTIVYPADEYTLPNTINVTKEGSSISVNANLTLSWDRSGLNTSGYTTFNLVLCRNGVDYLYMDNSAMVGSLYGGGSDSDYVTVNQTIKDCPSGIYSLRITLYKATSGDEPRDIEGIISASTLQWSFAQSGIRSLEFGRDGFFALWENMMFHVSQNNGFVLTGKTNIPGVLASGTINTDGSRVANTSWGAKNSTANATGTSGTYTVSLINMSHANYQVQITPYAASRLWYVSAKTATSFTVVITNTSGAATATKFDYTVIGNNY